MINIAVLIIVDTACCVGFLCLGIHIGQNIKNKKLDAKIQKAQDLLEKIKTKNNDLVAHISTIYSYTKHDHGKFTEIDEMLTSMWMD